MGNSSSSDDTTKEVVKKIGSFALAVSYFTPAVIVTGPATAAVGTFGVGMRIAGEIKDDDGLKETGNFFMGVASDAAIDGISGGAIDGVKKCGTMVKLVKTGCEAYSSASDEVNRVSGKPFIPTPDPQKTVYIAKNIKYFLWVISKCKLCQAIIEKKVNWGQLVLWYS